MTRRLAATLLAFLSFLGLTGVAGAAPPQETHFTLTYSGPAVEETPLSFVATGAITGTGVDVLVSSRQTGRSSHDVDDLVFDSGDVITINPHSVAITDTFDPATCTGSSLFKGNFKFLSGTGDYAGIRGHGHFTGSVTFQATPTPEGCDDASGTLAIRVDADAKVKL